MSEDIAQDDSVHAELTAAFAADAGVADAAPPVAAPEPVAAEPSGQPRDESGKFAAKVEGALASPAQTIPTEQHAAPPEALQEPSRPPASLSAQVKAEWTTLPEHVRQDFIRREAETNRGFEERAAQLKRYEPLEAVIAPHRNRIAMSGVDEATYVGSLIAADDLLRTNPIQGMAQVAQMYGIDLRQLSQPGNQAAAAQEAQLPPQVQAALDRIQSFEQQQTQQQTASQQAEIDAFGKDHLYFENVRAGMAALLRAEQATTLEDAYDKACWADPAIRPLLMKEQATKADEQARAAAGAKVANARGAAVSVTGSPAPGSGPAAAGPAPSIREELERAMSAGSA